eukprot:TRINITY_DN12471_c0_g1_i2.p1 TRINITY_DN12471_c0_g1~~TRINITY_DN12471_c0_g1_i2.p1  ORF type:complete len:966 (+),score=178.82 TRINITY_DN12471_c0_g1_i2:77-2974(+)
MRQVVPDGCQQVDRAHHQRYSVSSKSALSLNSLYSVVNEADESSSDEDDQETGRAATEVDRIHELLQEHSGKMRDGASALVPDIGNIPYKRRFYTGSLLHVAALSHESHGLLEKLLQMKADANESAHGEWPGVASKLKVQPIHLAAAVGNLDALRSLIHHRVEVDAQSKHDQNDHYTALHNAVWFSNDEAVQYLIRKKANVDIQNTKGETPLHLAVKSHDLPIVRQLVMARAKWTTQAKDGATCVDLAIQCCPEALSMTTEKSMKTLLQIAKVGADEHMAYKTIIGKDGKLKEAWQKAMKDESARSPDTFLEDTLKLCKQSPLAAATLLDGLAVEPAAANPQYGVPKTARVHLKFFPTALLEDMEWPDPTCLDGQKQSRWMRQLCNAKPADLLQPSATTRATACEQDDEDEQLVSIKVVVVKGLVCPEFLEVIAGADENGDRICQSIVSLAVMNFCWLHFARATAVSNIIYRLLAVALMTCSVFLEIVPNDAPLFLKQACWNVVAAIISYEVLHSLVSLAKVMYQAISKSFLETVRHNITNLCEWIFNGVSFYMIYISAQQGFDVCAVPPLAAVTLLVRWLLLAWSLRTVDGVGQILLPIIFASFEPVKGVLLVAFFGFLAFFSAFLTLGSQVENLSILGVLINTMRLLLLGDGDGIDAVLRAFGDDEAEFQLIGVVFLAAAIFMFVIVILNLLIAAYGEASLKDGEIKFRQQRARVCLNGWNMPSWPFGCSVLRLPDGNIVSVYLAVILIGLLGWTILFALARDHAAICGWPAMALFLGDCILNQKPWPDTEDGPRLLHLWMCYQQKLENEHRQNSETQDSHQDHYKKLSRRLDMRHRKLHRKMAQMMFQAESMIKQRWTEGVDQQTSPNLRVDDENSAAATADNPAVPTEAWQQTVLKQLEKLCSGQEDLRRRLDELEKNSSRDCTSQEDLQQRLDEPGGPATEIGASGETLEHQAENRVVEE